MEDGKESVARTLARSGAAVAGALAFQFRASAIFHPPSSRFSSASLRPHGLQIRVAGEIGAHRQRVEAPAAAERAVDHAAQAAALEGAVVCRAQQDAAGADQFGSLRGETVEIASGLERLAAARAGEGRRIEDHQVPRAALAQEAAQPVEDVADEELVRGGIEAVAGKSSRAPSRGSAAKGPPWRCARRPARRQLKTRRYRQSNSAPPPRAAWRTSRGRGGGCRAGQGTRPASSRRRSRCRGAGRSPWPRRERQSLLPRHGPAPAARARRVASNTANAPASGPVASPPGATRAAPPGRGRP